MEPIQVKMWWTRRVKGNSNDFLAHTTLVENHPQLKIQLHGANHKNTRDRIVHDPTAEPTMQRKIPNMPIVYEESATKHNHKVREKSTFI